MSRPPHTAKDVQNYVDRSLVLTHAFVPIIEVREPVELKGSQPPICARSTDKSQHQVAESGVAARVLCDVYECKLATSPQQN